MILSFISTSNILLNIKFKKLSNLGTDGVKLSKHSSVTWIASITSNLNFKLQILFHLLSVVLLSIALFRFSSFLLHHLSQPTLK